MRVRPAASAFALAMVCALAGCAGVGEPSGQDVAGSSTSVGTDCFTTSLARDFRYLDDNNLIVFAPARQAYHLELSGVCIALRGQVQVALRSRTDRMCGFAGDAVIVDGAFAERCPVLSVTRLDEDRLQALVEQFDPDTEAGSEFEVVIPAEQDVTGP